MVAATTMTTAVRHWYRPGRSLARTTPAACRRRRRRAPGPRPPEISQTRRNQRNETPVDVASDPAQQAEAGVVRQEPVGIPEDTASDAEEANRNDGDHKRQDRRLPGGLLDEIGGDGHQANRRHDGQDTGGTAPATLARCVPRSEASATGREGASDPRGGRAATGAGGRRRPIC